MHARIVSGAAALLTRNGLDWTAKYPDVAAAIGALECRQAYLDGELCAVLPDGTTSFSALQGHGDAPAALVYFAFDLLHLDGEDLMRLPLLERKARLEARPGVDRADGLFLRARRRGARHEVLKAGCITAREELFGVGRIAPSAKGPGQCELEVKSLIHREPDGCRGREPKKQPGRRTLVTAIYLKLASFFVRAE